MCVCLCIYMSMYMYVYIRVCININIYMYICLCVNMCVYTSSSSSCRVASTDIPGPLSPLLPIVNHLQQVFRPTSCEYTYMCVYMCICVCAYIYIYIYIYICVYIYVYICLYIYIYIYNVSQKWVHPSHFCRYLSITFHGTTLTMWHFETMKSSLCAAYITELIYFPLKITQNITIKS